MEAFNIIIVLVVSLTLFMMGAARELQDDASSLADMHNQWMAKHGRVYKDSNEKEMRFRIFKENFGRIQELNNKNVNGSYKLALNKFSDLTPQEFLSQKTGFLGHVSSPRATTPFRYQNVTEIPDNLDWRKERAVTHIKNQHRCGSCWAFSAVAAVEGINKIKTGNLISLSEQELVDCDTNDGNSGCDGGLMNNAFQFIKQNGGLTTEDNYPYKGEQGTCNSTAQEDNVVQINGHENVPQNNEKALLKAVSKQPVSVAIEASGDHFRFYNNGIFDGACGTELDHGVVVVGYGESDEGKYWIVKNSWGTDWGEEGYIRMKRDVDHKSGLCGIAMEASFPV